MLLVSSKHLPASHKLSKVHGSAFHPLPLEETLKQLPLPTEPLPSHAELFILDTNPLYSQTELPSSASALNIDQRIMEVE